MNPTSIHMVLLYNPLTKVWCWIYDHMYFAYLYLTPLTLLMFTIERLVYIRNPTTHGQKFGIVAISLMLALPWVISILVGIVISAFYEYDIKVETVSKRNWDVNETRYDCFLMPAGENMYLSILRLIAIGNDALLLPMISSLIISIVALGMWCCHKRKRSHETNRSVDINIRDSVIAVSVLNFLFIVIMISELTIRRQTMPVRASAFTIYGVIEGIVLLATLKDVRDKIASYCSICFKRRGDGAALQSASKGEENVDI